MYVHSCLTIPRLIGDERKDYGNADDDVDVDVDDDDDDTDNDVIIIIINDKDFY